ncbi:phenylalanine--tRNA ligase subunit beta [Candidatus Omnitrophota bacterium]
MRVSLNWLKDYVDIRTPVEALAEKLTMAGLEVTSMTKMEKDTIMEIEVTPNRADCLSILGIAREVAAVTGKKIKFPKISAIRGKASLRIPIQIQDKNLCPRYLGRAIKNIKVGPSPDWLVERLEAMGVHSVNNIVDVTNFCLLEFGQPLHAFDLDKLEGSRLVVRRAKSAEQIVTIDGVKRDLESSMLVIADKFRPQAIAGVMGAQESEVTESTTTILLESAYFDPLNIHRTSRKLGLATQSSYRFERGVDPEGVYWASLRATELIKRLSIREKRKTKPVAIGGLVDKGQKGKSAAKVQLRYAQVEQLLGVTVAPGQIKEIMRRLQFSILRRSKLGLTVAIPSFRPDISREADLIEEIGRLYGYDQIPTSLAQLAPDLSYAGSLQLESEQTYNLIREGLCALGLNEIITYSLISRQALRKLGGAPLFDNTISVTNPLSYTQEILRPTLLVGMLNTILANLNRKNSNLELFELSRTYTRENPDSPAAELDNLCIGIAGKGHDNWLTKSAEFSFFDLKGVVEALFNKLGLQEFSILAAEFPLLAPGRSAELLAGGEAIGFLGELKQEIRERFDIETPVYIAELSLHKLLPSIAPEKSFMPLAKFPSVERDISLIAPPDVSSGEIIALIKKMGRDLVAQVKLFDQYFGEQIPQGSRGLAYSIEYRNPERTLTAEEVDQLHLQVRRALSEELKLQIR